MTDSEIVSTAFDALCIQLVMGTGRSPEIMPELPGGLGRFVPASAPREDQILHALSALDTYRYVGACPQPVALSAVVPAPSESQPGISHRAGYLFHEVLLMKRPAELPGIVMETILRSRKRLPEERLPEFLDWAAAHLVEAIPCLSILGARGAWLAKMNPSWQEIAVAANYLLFESQEGLEAWENGSLSERQLLLRIFRYKGLADSRFLEASRQMMQNTWHSDSAASRASFLGICTLGLGAGDEEFLKLSLSDSSKEVRKTGVGLLSCLPGSEWEKRMAERASNLVRFQPSKMLRKPSIELTLPDSFSREMAADGLVENPPGNVSLTAQAWWLLQIVSYVEPGRWCEQFGRTPEQLLALATQSDWKGLLFSAWIQAARNFRSEVWAEALLRLHPGESGLLAVLPALKADEFIQVRLRASFVDGLTLLSNHARAWSVDLTELFVARLETFLGSEGAVPYPGPMQERLIGMAAWMHGSGEADLTRLAANAGKVQARWQQNLSEMMTVIALRKNLEEEINHG